MLGLPTLHGTGTEDYFNCAWCPTQIYHAPYHGVIAGGGKNWTDPVTVYGFTSRIRLSSKSSFGWRLNMAMPIDAATIFLRWRFGTKRNRIWFSRRYCRSNNACQSFGSHLNDARE
jgi:hypothetical protein